MTTKEKTFAVVMLPPLDGGPEWRSRWTRQMDTVDAMWSREDVTVTPAAVRSDYTVVWLTHRTAKGRVFVELGPEWVRLSGPEKAVEAVAQTVVEVTGGTIAT